MLFIRKLIILIIVLFVYKSGVTQSVGDTIILKGTIGNSFLFANTHNLQESQKKDFLKRISSFSSKINILDQYYMLENYGEHEKAKILLKSDRTLLKMSSFDIAFHYFITKMHNLNVLFLPLIKCSSSDYLIICKTEQLEELYIYLNHNIEIQLTCVYMANFPMDQTELVELVKF